MPKHHALLITISLLLFGAAPGFCTPIPPDTAQVFRQVDSLMNDWIARQKIPGLVAGVTYKGKVVYLKSFGKITGEGPAMPKEAIFRLASMTKPVTAASAALLIQQGKMGLEDPVARYLPAFSTLTTIKGEVLPVADSALRIRHLLTHTAGFSYGIFDTAMAKYYKPIGFVDAFTLDTLTLAGNILTLSKAPLAHKPGEAWTYGVSIDVLGRVVEVVSGKRIGEFMEENFFEPLDMEQTAFHLSDDVDDQLVPVNYFSEGKWRFYPADGETKGLTEYAVQGAGTYDAPGAGLCGTARDYLQFTGMLAQGGIWNEKRILDSTTVIRMGSNLLPAPLPDWEQFGYGMAIEPAKATALHPNRPGHMDWSGLFNTYFFTDPSEELSAVLMTQLYPGSQYDFFQKFSEMLYQIAKP